MKVKLVGEKNTYLIIKMLFYIKMNIIKKNIIKEFEDKLKGYSPLTVKNYVCQVNKLFKEYNIINENNVVKFIREENTILRKMSIKKFCELFYPSFSIDWKKIKVKSTDRTEFQTILYNELSFFLKEISEDEIIILTKKFKHLKNLSDEEIKKYGINLYKQLKLILMLGFDTGARIRAILKLRKRDIKIFKDEVKIQLVEKGDKKLFMKITDETYSHLQLYILKYEENNCIFFGKSRVSLEDMDMKYYELWSILKNMSRKILGKGISFHWIRRGAGYKIYEDSGKDIVATAEFFGHKSSAQTQKYLKITSKRLEEVLKKQKRDW